MALQGDDNPARAWKFFERVYCISLEGRSDRRRQAREQFAGVGLLERVEFVRVREHPHDRAQGIFESHQLCLNMGLAAGARHILIFEDDVFFHFFDPVRLQRACRILDGLPSWDAFFLGCITEGMRRTDEPSLVRVNYRCLSHGYAVSSAFARRLAATSWQGIPLDTQIKHLARHCYALSPMCAFQGLAGSDNQTVAIDRLRRLCGGLPFIQRASEFYQRYKPYLLASHIVVLATLVFLLLRTG
jgi:hypothetical protein